MTTSWLVPYDSASPPLRPVLPRPRTPHRPAAVEPENLEDLLEALSSDTAKAERGTYVWRTGYRHRAGASTAEAVIKLLVNTAKSQNPRRLRRGSSSQILRICLASSARRVPCDTQGSPTLRSLQGVVRCALFRVRMRMVDAMGHFMS